MKIRHAQVPVLVPEGATDEEADALVAQALYRAYTAAARRGGVEPLPARVARPRQRESVYPPGPPSPASAETVPQFLDRMRALRKWAKISYEKLEQRAGRDEDGALRLPHSTMNRLLASTNDSRMPDQEQLAAFVLACGLSEEQWREWAMVWADIQSTGRAEWGILSKYLLDRLRFRGAFPSSADAVVLRDGTLIQMSGLSSDSRGKTVALELN